MGVNVAGDRVCVSFELATKTGARRFTDELEELGYRRVSFRGLYDGDDEEWALDPVSKP